MSGGSRFLPTARRLLGESLPDHPLRHDPHLYLGVAVALVVPPAELVDVALQVSWAHPVVGSQKQKAWASLLSVASGGDQVA